MSLNPILSTGKKKLILKTKIHKAILEEMYYPPEERFNGKKEIDSRKLNYSYFWVDYKQAASVPYKQDYKAGTGKYDGAGYKP